MPTIDELRATYREMSQGRLLELAVSEAGELTPEAAQVLQEELARREVSNTVQLTAAAQTRTWTPEETEALMTQFRQIPCPICGGTGHLLNAFLIVSVKSFMVVTLSNQQWVVGCPQCVARAAKKASWRSLVSGWWGFPWGLIRTCSALYRNGKVQEACQATDPAKEVKEFVTQQLTEFITHNRGLTMLLLKSSRSSVPEGQVNDPGALT